MLDLRVGGPLDRIDLLQPCEALLDTGADITLIPVGLIEQLGLVPVDSVPVSHGGSAEVSEEEVFAAALDIPALGRSIVRVIPTSDPFALLGRDVLNKLLLVFDGPNLTFEITS